MFILVYNYGAASSWFVFDRLSYTLPSLCNSLPMVRQRHKEADGRLLQETRVLMFLTQVISVEILRSFQDLAPWTGIAIDYIIQWGSQFLAILTFENCSDFRFDILLSDLPNLRATAVWPGNFLVSGRLLNWIILGTLFQVAVRHIHCMIKGNDASIDPIVNAAANMTRHFPKKNVFM